MSTLKLTLKKQWFDMILSGEKTEEYREIKEFWALRLMLMDSELVIDKAGNKYNKKQLNGAYWYSVGLCGKRVGAVKYLLWTCCSFKQFDTIHFFNGAYYSELLPNFKIECKGIEIRAGDTRWGAERDTDYFAIKLGKILTTNP